MKILHSEDQCAEPQSIQPDSQLPHRKVIRSWLKPGVQRSTLRAILLLTLDSALFATCLVGAALLDPWWAKMICGLLAGLMIGRLFIIGHDACHQSYTPLRGLNKLLGRVAMLPSLTPYSLWQTGHNVVHHGYTNLKGADFVWAPLTYDEYRTLPATRRVMERIYRSGWGSCAYYLVEMWWLRMFFPSNKYMRTQRPEFFWDSLLVTIAGVCWITSLIYVAQRTGQSTLLLVLFGFIVPFLFWNALIGFVVYVHHTHPQVPWYADKRQWAASAPFVSTTVHLIFPYRIGGLLHHIMEHTAHHVDMSIPLYDLKRAQKILEDTLPERITIQKFSWRWYFDTARKCKLYDFERQCWIDFSGRPTTEP